MPRSNLQLEPAVLYFILLFKVLLYLHGSIFVHKAQIFATYKHVRRVWAMG